MTSVPNLVAWREPASEVRIQIVRWLVTEPVQEQYIVHPHSLWLLWNYWRRVGLRCVMRKIRSRMAESRRNRKVYGLGIGKVLEAPDNTPGVAPDCLVLFFSPNQHEDAIVISLHHGLVLALEETEGSAARSHATAGWSIPAELEAYSGWSAYSGHVLVEAVTRRALEIVAKQISINERNESTVGNSTSFTEEVTTVVRSNGKRTAVLFGLGNYAKTSIIPNINGHLSLQRVHEIDPDQMAFFGTQPSVNLDTSPMPRDGLRFDAWFIAGFHHSHAVLAVAAIHQQAYAIVEKPLATTRIDYDRFVATLNARKGGRFFICFHKRYSQLHDLAVRDLAIARGEPVDMHCVVYEVPLPMRHWYNWPNSGSRIISNGCHWIDYFMLHNDYTPAADFNVWSPRGADVCVQIKLTNGAYFSMVLTDTGSQRIGVRDHIELRHGGTTVTMSDAAGYRAENRQRIFRKASVNPMDAYGIMYRRIAQAIASGQAGDTRESLRSSELVLSLEEELIRQGPRR